MRPFRFGVVIGNAGSGEEWANKARKAEDLGYSSLLVPDHFMQQLSPMVALAAAASATESLRLGTIVLDNDFRHPAVLAKDVATLDLLSGGRFELGLGAGWMTADYEQTGIAFDPPGVRVSRLAESITVLKGLFADEPLTFAGSHYAITAMNGHPKPIQRPHPPLLVGASAPRMLRLAAREADIVAINSSTSRGTFSPETWRDAMTSSFKRKVAIVREAAGSRIDEVEMAAWVFFTNVTSDRASAANQLAAMLGVESEDILDNQSALIGAPDELIDDVGRRRDELGISYLIVLEPAMEPFAPIVAKLAGT
jgi:probable F420-dependent oxidoreductase